MCVPLKKHDILHTQDTHLCPIKESWIPQTRDTEFKPFIMKYILKRWQDSCDRQIAIQLHEIHHLVCKAMKYRFIP